MKQTESDKTLEEVLEQHVFDTATGKGGVVTPDVKSPVVVGGDITVVVCDSDVERNDVDRTAATDTDGSSAVGDFSNNDDAG